MGRPSEEIPDEFTHRCDDLRREAEEAFALRSQADAEGLSTLEKVAWFAGMDQSNDQLTANIVMAKKSGASWKAIAIALGEGTDPKSVNRVRNRYFGRTAAY